MHCWYNNDSAFQVYLHCKSFRPISLIISSTALYSIGPILLHVNKIILPKLSELEGNLVMNMSWHCQAVADMVILLTTRWTDPTLLIHSNAKYCLSIHSSASDDSKVSKMHPYLFDYFCNIFCQLQVNDDQSSNNSHQSPLSNGVLTSKSTNPQSNNKKGATEYCVASTMTDPELLGPCQPGTAVKLQGAVLQECHGK